MDNNQENKTPIGNIFDNINYYSLEHLDEFIKNMTYEQALYFLIEATQAGFRRNTYSLTECEVVSRSIRRLSIKE
jgi:hypothetical protein